MTKEHKDYILEKLQIVGTIFCRPMMGGYLFYYDNILFGGIYEHDNFLIKKTASNEKYGLPSEIPYQGGKPMYLIDSFEDGALLRNIILDTCKDLPKKKK